MATLWLLGNTESFRSVADRFGMSKSSLHLFVMTVCKGLCEVQGAFIKWPTPEEQLTISQAFHAHTGFPGVIGCVDGTHVPISGPSHHRDSYINRKGYPSVQVQAICDNNLKFTDVCVGWPGSVHDARVYRNSPIRKYITDHPLPADRHLLGDSAYPLTTDMLVPFRDNGHLDVIQKSYNMCHSKTRVCIENAFGLLKGKFRRMKMLDMHNTEDIPVVITAALVLHNFILLSERITSTDIDNEVVAIDAADIGEDDLVIQQGQAEAKEKRRHISEMLV